VAGATDLHLLAQDILGYAAAALNLIPVSDATLDPAPERQYVSPGLPVHDCEQLTVHLTGPTEDPAAPEGLTGGALASGMKRHLGRVNMIGYMITVARCIPIGDGTPPLVEALELASAQTDADAWALWQGAHAMVRDGQLLDRCQSLAVLNMVALTPSGGIGGWTLQVLAQVDGWRVTLP
jgi:hypothetical protein